MHLPNLKHEKQRKYKGMPVDTLEPETSQPNWCRVTFARCINRCGERLEEIDPWKYSFAK
jgi:hypothetical protein